MIEDGAARLEVMLDIGLDDDVIRLAPMREGPTPIRIAAYVDEVGVWSELREWGHEIDVREDGVWRDELRSLVAAVVEGRHVGDLGTRRPPHRG